MKNIKDLMKRYNISRQGIMAFVDRHLGEINADGVEHARQTTEGWQFDDTAVRIIDKLRGLSEVTIVEREESERVQELKDENDNLKNLLLMAQNELLQTQKKLNQKQEELTESQKRLLLAENTSTVEELKRKHLEEKLSEVQNQCKNLQSEVEKLKRRGLVSRIFNNL